MTSIVLTESTVLTTPATDSKGIWRVCIIEADVQGSSGYYPADVLMRDGPTAFPAGTHVYLDHPTRSEEDERPERSVLDLAGYLVDDARFEDAEDGRGLFTRIQFLPSIKDRIAELAEHVGLSIRASGAIEETDQGRVVRSISNGLSVDVVTRAGAGGRLVVMTESASDNPTKTEETGSIPATSGTGALVNEVAALRESFADRLDQQQVEIARLSNLLRENQQAQKQRDREYSELREGLLFLKERQKENDQAIAESKGVGDVTADLLESGLPVASLVRIAKTYRAGQDIHEIITAERDYAKKLLRESERGSLTRSESGLNLGITESAPKDDFRAPDDKEMAELDSVLSGKLY